MSGEDEEGKEVEELQETVAAAVRAPQRGDLEQILASSLAAAVFAPPLDKIRMVLEAFMLLPEEDQLKVAAEEGELQYIKELHEVAVSLSSVVELEPPTPLMRGRFASIPWSFPIDRADRYLGHFVNRIWWFLEGPWGTEEWERLLNKLRGADRNSPEGQAIWRTYLQELARWLGSGWAPLSNVEQFKNEFIVRVMPYASRLLREIFTNYISRETWEAMLSIVSGGRKPKAGAVEQP
jgi:hypothetical protein